MENAAYVYEFCNEKVVLEGIDPEWIVILQDLDREEYNNGRKAVRHHHVSLEAYDPKGTVLENGSRAESLALEREFLDTLQDVLTDRQLEVLCLHYWQGLTLRDTALAMGVSAGTVKKMSRLIYRALENLQEGGMA